MGKNSCFIEYCEYVDDFRQEGKVKHLLKDILFIAVATTIGNADSWPQVEAFAEDHEDWLRNYLELPYGIPSHDTYERVFDRIDPLQFSKAFNAWTNDIADRSGQAIVAIDGKTVRGSFDNQIEKSAIHIVNAWISTNSLILGQLKTSEKSNEITAIPELLDILLVKDCIITIDAMGCQKNIAEKIIEKKPIMYLLLREINNYFMRMLLNGLMMLKVVVLKGLKLMILILLTKDMEELKKENTTFQKI